MEKTTIKIGSSTLAMRGCEIIKANGINCEMKKISEGKNGYGCIYSINVDSKNGWNAEKLLRSAGIMLIP